MSDNPLIDIPVDVLSEAVLPPIIKVPVSSSAIRYATYIKTERLLTLDMHDGTQIEYYDVPPHTFLALVDAASPGGYYNHHIRRGFRSMQRA